MRMPPETGPGGATDLIGYLGARIECETAANQFFELAREMTPDRIEFLPPLEEDQPDIEFPEGLEALLEAATRLWDAFHRDGSPQALAMATAAWKEVVESPRFGSAPGPLRAMVHNSLAIAHQHRYLGTGDEARADLAQHTWQLGIAETDPGSPQHRELASNAGLGQSDRCGRSFRVDLADDAVRLLELACDSGCPPSPAMADSLRNLSAAYYARFEGTGSVADLDGAIERARQAASMAPQGERLHAEILTNLGVFLVERFSSSGEGKLIVEAVDMLREASSVNTGPSKCATEVNLAEALIARHEWSGDEADLVEAISILRTTSSADLSAENAAHAKFNLGIALVRRHLGFNDPAALDEATRLFDQADAAGPPAFLANARASLGRALSEACRESGDPELLDRAVYLLRLAAAGVPEGDHLRVGILHSLAIVLDERFAQREIPEDFAEAEKVIRQAVAIADAKGTAYSALLTSFANILRESETRPADLARLGLRLTTARRAVETSRSEPPAAHAAASLALGSALRASFDLTENVSHLRDAIILAREAAASAQPGAQAPAQASLAGLLRRYRNVVPHEVSHEEVADAYRSAVRLGITMRPVHALETAIAWGSWAMSVQDWQAGVEAARAAAAAACLVGAAQSDAHGEGFWLERSLETHEALAFGLAKTGDLQGAVVAVEEGRSRSFYRPLQLSQDDGRLVFTAPVPAALTFDQIVATARDQPLVYLITIAFGALALIVPPARSGSPAAVYALWADDYCAATSETLLMQSETGRLGWLRAYLDWHHTPQREGSLDAAIEALSNSLEKLWQVMLGQVVEWLLTHDFKAATFLPSPALSVLPIHAARNPASGRMVVDDLAISYSPCVSSLNVGCTNDSSQDRLVLSVSDDRISGPLPPLPFAQLEGIIVAEHFPGCVRIDVSAVRLKQVCTEMLQATILHFACHGRADHNHPLMSGLSAANDAELPLGLILSLPPVSRRLALLIGCDTGLVSLSALHRGISLSAGFIAAGCQGVISSQWALPDWCGTLLTLRLLDTWDGGKQGLAFALREAQLWLRDTTWDAKLAYLRSGAPSDARMRLADTLAQLDSKPETAHPFYWAAGRLLGS
jgi:CHAT domain-containing protein